MPIFYKCCRNIHCGWSELSQGRSTEDCEERIRDQSDYFKFDDTIGRNRFYVLPDPEVPELKPMRNLQRNHLLYAVFESLVLQVNQTRDGYQLKQDFNYTHFNFSASSSASKTSFGPNLKTGFLSSEINLRISVVKTRIRS